MYAAAGEDTKAMESFAKVIICNLDSGAVLHYTVCIQIHRTCDFFRLIPTSPLVELQLHTQLSLYRELSKARLPGLKAMTKVFPDQSI